MNHKMIPSYATSNFLEIREGSILVTSGVCVEIEKERTWRRDTSVSSARARHLVLFTMVDSKSV